VPHLNVELVYQDEDLLTPAAIQFVPRPKTSLARHRVCGAEPILFGC